MSWIAVGAAVLATGVAVGPVAADEATALRPDGCTVVGTPGSDVLVGGPGDDVICGRGGADRLVGGGGHDVLRGGGGDDTLVGGAGDDVVNGGAGRDVLQGGPGDDMLRARDGARDVLECGPGRDRTNADLRDALAADCMPDRRPNRPPTDVTLAPASVPENQPAGTEVGRWTATDPDRDDAHTFELVPGPGAADNDAFTVEGDRLVTATVLDFEDRPELAVRVRATDAAGAHVEKSLVVTVVDESENRAPVAVDDRYTLVEDGRLDLPVTSAGGPAGNDTDADGDPLTVIAVSDAVGGSVAVDAGTIRFSAAPDVCGPAAGGFRYVVADGRGGVDTGRVAVDISCVQDPAVARDDNAAVGEDDPATAVDVLANDADVDGGTFAVASVTQPLNGTVAITGGGTGLTYAPDPDYCNDDGSALDTFTYTLDAGSVGTVRVTVVCVDDAPVAVDDSATVAEDDAAAAVDVLGNDTDVDGGPKSVATVTQPADGTVVVTGGGTGLSYAPDANYCNDPGAAPADTFTYTLNGGSTATVSVTVTCADDAPVALADASTVAEDASATAVDVLANDTDADGGPKSVASVTQPVNGTVVVTGGGTGLSYAPDADHCDPTGLVPDTFTYTLNGGSTATVSVTVTCVDDAPVAVTDAATVVAGDPATAVDVLANDTDVDGGPKSVASVTQPANGTVVVTGGGAGVTYEPDAGYCNDTSGTEPDRFTYTLAPGGSTATVSMTVVCDAPPTAVGDAFTVVEDAAAGSLDVLANDTDVDGGPKSVASVTQPADGTVVVTGGGTGLSYAPDANYCNDPGAAPADTFTYTLNGGSTATVSVTVTCADDAPVALADASTVAEDDAAAAVDVLANDTDVDGGPRSVASVTQPVNGTVVVTGGGTGLTYAPDANYCNDPGAAPADTFTYTLNGGSTATVSVTVTCVADRPVLTTSAGPTTYTENGAPVVVDLGVGLANPDVLTITSGSVEITSGAGAGDELDWSDNDSSDGITEGASTAGALVLVGNGTEAEYVAALRAVTYRNTSENPSTVERTVTFTVGASAGAASDTIALQVTAVDDAPVAGDDAVTVTEDATATALAVLADDTDVDGGASSVTSVTQPANGIVVITGFGTGLTYRPVANYCNDAAGTAKDTFTYTLTPGGSTATVTVTVTCVNDAPVADDETFDGTRAAVGNTVLVVDDATDAAPAEDGPHKTVAGDLLAGDTDVDGPGPLTIVAGTFATDNGGTVVLEADGDFTYTPAAGTGCTDTSDHFDYTVADGSTPVAGTDTGRVTVALAGCVHYVANDSSGDAGTSTAPFDTLAEAEAVSRAGDTIFVFEGDGTGYASGIDLVANQSLVGEVADLRVGSDLLWTGVPGARPTLTATNADVVRLAAGNTLRGLLIDPSGAGGGIAGGAGDAGGTIADVRIIDTGTAGTQPGLELDGTSGTFTVSDLVVDSTSATGQTAGSVGVRLNNAGTVGFAGAGTVSLATKGAKALEATGTHLGSGSVFDAITVTGSGSGAVSMTSTTGTTTFSALSLTTTSGAAAAFALNSAGTVAVAVGGTADVTAAGGPAVDVVATPGATLAFDTVISTGSASDGVNLVGLGAGVFTADSGSAITNAGGVAFDLDGGSGWVTYDGSITDDLGRLVQVSGTTSGTKEFSGAIGDGADGDGGGISLTNNTGAVIRFDGGLTLSTGSNPALVATGGGTVAVADPAGAASNTLQTTTGTALDVVGTTIAADGMTFERVGSNGASVGIRLSDTGGAGRLVVTGAGGTCTNAVTTGCSGGTIANGTGGDDASPTPGGSGIVLNNTLNPSFTRMWIHDHANYAVRGTGVAGFTLANSVVNGLNGTNASSPYNDSSVRFDNLSGSAAISNSHVSGGLADNVRVVNTVGSLNRITITGVAFGAGGNGPGNDALLLESSPSAGQLHATIAGSTFSSAAGDLLQFNHNGSGTGDLVLTGNTFSNAHAAIANGGGGVSLSSGGASGGNTTMDITGNSFRGARGTGVLIVKTTGAATQAGTFADNTIGATGVANSGSVEGSALKLQQVGQGTSTWSVTNNQIRQYNNYGIEVLAGGGGSAQSGTINTTITANTIEQPGSSAATLGIAKEGIHFNIGTSAGDSFQACAVIGGSGALANQVHASGSDAVDVRLRQRQATTFRLPGYVGAAADTGAVQTFVNSRNSGGTATLASTSVPPGGGFTGTGTSCP